jgi:hypothetical protein
VQEPQFDFYVHCSNKEEISSISSFKGGTTSNDCSVAIHLIVSIIFHKSKETSNDFSNKEKVSSISSFKCVATSSDFSAAIHLIVTTIFLKSKEKANRIRAQEEIHKISRKSTSFHSTAGDIS